MFGGGIESTFCAQYNVHYLDDNGQYSMHSVHIWATFQDPVQSDRFLEKARRQAEKEIGIDTEDVIDTTYCGTASEDCCC